LRRDIYKNGTGRKNRPAGKILDVIISGGSEVVQPIVTKIGVGKPENQYSVSGRAGEGVQTDCAAHTAS
jgi:hypothetical protein